jgi:hypothetical protein
MTRGVRWLFTWLGVVCLLWSLSLHADVHTQSHVGRDPSVRPWSHAGLTCIGAFPSMSTARMRTRAGPLDVSAPHGSLMVVTAGDGGPPWVETRGPPGAAGRPSVRDPAAGHAGGSNERPRYVVSRKLTV